MRASLAAVFSPPACVAAARAVLRQVLFPGLISGLLLTLLPALLPALSPGGWAEARAASLAVAVSIPPQKYFVEKIAGSAVTVTVAVGKGQDPHAYDPKAAAMAALSRASLYFAIGVPFEDQWLPRFRDLNPAMRVVFLADAVEKIPAQPDLALRDAAPGTGRARRGGSHAHGSNPEPGHAPNHAADHAADHATDHEAGDPHLWLSPAAMLRTIPPMVAALAEALPDQAREFARRGRELEAEITALQSRIQDLFAPLPPEHRVFLTFHQSWTYYARNFNLHEASVELDGREPSPRSMSLLMDFARQHHIRVILTDPLTPRAQVQAIAAALPAAIVIADPLAENWPAALLDLSTALAKALADQAQPGTAP